MSKQTIGYYGDNADEIVELFMVNEEDRDERLKAHYRQGKIINGKWVNDKEDEEEVETNCVICDDYMSDVEQEDYEGGCNTICNKCGGEESEEGCWWIKGKGGDKCWEENCGCSEGEELEECDRCGHEDIIECMSNKCRDLEGEEQQKAQEIIEKIKHEIPFVDIKPYSHNIINLELRLLEEVAGREAVVELVQTTELKNKGWGFITSIGGVGENLNV